MDRGYCSGSITGSGTFHARRKKEKKKKGEVGDAQTAHAFYGKRSVTVSHWI
jgi:hypothetical protein